jgi:hypothetical protein
MFIKKRISKLIILILFLILLKFVLAYDSNLDPMIQYNQSGQPYVAFGETPSGDYNDLNFLGDDLTYDIPEALDVSLYRLEVWHNSSQIADGNILSVNVSINFTTNVSDYYSLQIYDFENSEWVSTDCDFGNVLADTPTRWWCNKTLNSMNFNSSDRKVRVRINSTDDNDVGLLKEDYIQYFIGYQASYLEVNITRPDPSFTTNVIQNFTFPINATIVCRDGPCGEVTGTARYNLSSPNPDTPVNTTLGDKPFYVQEVPAEALKSCGIMYKDQTCKLNWNINATGYIGTSWKIGVLFNSSYPEVKENHTDNSTVSITPCTEDFSLAWTSIRFGLLNSGTEKEPAPENNNNVYNITVNSGSCNLDFYIKGTDLENKTLNSVIEVRNITWSNTSNSYTSSFNLTKTDEVIKLNIPQNTNVTTWYWINVPFIYAGYYNGTITITSVKNV